MTHRDFSQLLSNLQTLSPMQLRRLRQRLDSQLAPPKKRTPARKAQRPQPAVPQPKPLTPDDFNRRLLAAGRIAALPDPALDSDDDDPADAPVTIRGEPLSETILREPR
jgi:hypothetical protein